MTLDRYIRKAEKEKEKKAKKKAKEIKKKEIKKIKKNKGLEKDKKKKAIKEIAEKYKDMSPKAFLYDLSKKAKPKGRRVSKNGNIYYEYRRNRTDTEDGI